MIVRSYRSAEAFEAGLDRQSALGWVLHSWKIAVYPEATISIIAVFTLKN